MVPVLCPNCKKRLLDIDKNLEGSISIKCPRCKSVVVATYHRKSVDSAKLNKIKA